MKFEESTSDLESSPAEDLSQHQVSIRQEFIQYYQRVWLEAFHLISDLVELSDDELTLTVQHLCVTYS